MSRLLSSALLLLMMFTYISAADATTTAASLGGHWAVDPEATLKKIEGDPQTARMTAKFSPEELAQWRQKALADLAVMTFEFTNGKMTGQMFGEKQEGAYKAIRNEGKALIIEVDGKDGGKHLMRMEVAGDTLELANLEPGGISLLKVFVLKRKPAAK